MVSSRLPVEADADKPPRGGSVIAPDVVDVAFDALVAASVIAVNAPDAAEIAPDAFVGISVFAVSVPAAVDTALDAAGVRIAVAARAKLAVDVALDARTTLCAPPGLNVRRIFEAPRT